MRGRDHWGNPGVDVRIILNGSSGSETWGYGLD
jgi:predicted nucleotidyltransferase